LERKVGGRKLSADLERKVGGRKLSAEERTMIDFETYKKIRQHKKDKKSQRQCASDLGISRLTVSRYWNGEHYPTEESDREPRPDTPEKKAVCKEIEDLLENDSKENPPKQKLTAEKIHQILSRTYTIGKSTVRKYVREVRFGGMNPETDIPLTTRPGEVMEVDWCVIKVYIAEVLTKVSIFCAVLKFSYKIFCMPCVNEKFESFADAHVRAFAAIGGVPERVHYDNLKTAVYKHWGVRAIKQTRFAEFEAHYGYEARFMGRAKGNQKGSVEILCRISQHFASPIPRVNSFREVHEIIDLFVEEYNKTHEVAGKDGSVRERFELEQKHLFPLPLKEYEISERDDAHVRDDLTFSFDSNKYSVPHGYAGKTVTIKAHPYHLDVWHKGVVIATHERLLGKNKTSYNPFHYLPILKLKQRAVENAAPLTVGVLPKELDEFRENCKAKNVNEQLMKIMCLGEKHEYEVVRQGVEFALETGNCSFETVERYVSTHESVAGSVSEERPLIVENDHGEPCGIFMVDKEES
jgi:transposase